MAKKPARDLLGDDDNTTRTITRQDNVTTGGGVAGQQLKALIDRIENLEVDKAEIANDIKEVYSEAKGAGFDTKILRKVIARRKRKTDELQEEEAILQLYLQALGMI